MTWLFWELADGRFIVQNDLCFSLLHTNLFHGFRRLWIQSVSHMGIFFKAHLHCVHSYSFHGKHSQDISFYHPRKIGFLTVSKLWRNSSNYGWTLLYCIIYLVCICFVICAVKGYFASFHALLLSLCHTQILCLKGKFRRALFTSPQLTFL